MQKYTGISHLTTHAIWLLRYFCEYSTPRIILKCNPPALSLKTQWKQKYSTHTPFSSHIAVQHDRQCMIHLSVFAEKGGESSAILSAHAKNHIEGSARLSARAENHIEGKILLSARAGNDNEDKKPSPAHAEIDNGGKKPFPAHAENSQDETTQLSK